MSWSFRGRLRTILLSRSAVRVCLVLHRCAVTTRKLSFCRRRIFPHSPPPLLSSPCFSDCRWWDSGGRQNVCTKAITKSCAEETSAAGATAAQSPVVGKSTVTSSCGEQVKMAFARLSTEGRRFGSKRRSQEQSTPAPSTSSEPGPQIPPRKPHRKPGPALEGCRRKTGGSRWILKCAPKIRWCRKSNLARPRLPPGGI